MTSFNFWTMGTFCTPKKTPTRIRARITMNTDHGPSLHLPCAPLLKLVCLMICKGCTYNSCDVDCLAMLRKGTIWP